jgi:glycosyltransferase involved in cell wall biosynthesis
VIIFCHLLNDRSGSPTVLRSTLDALNASERGLLFVGSQGRGVLEEAGVPTRRYWYRRSRYRLITLFTFLASQMALYRALSRATDIPGDAVVFVNTLLPFAAMIWGRLTGRTVIVHVHEVSIGPAPLRKFLTWCASHCADRLLYVSNDHLSRLPINEAVSRIVFNPIDPAMQVKQAASLPYAPRRSGKFEVLMLASLKGYKGLGEFMSLAKALRDRDDIGFTLVLNAEDDEAAAFARRHAAADNVTIRARTDDPAAFYITADLVLNLSRVDEWIETFGLTILEAMLFGIPVVVPPIGGPAEIVTDGKEGLCIDSRDGAALRDAVRSLAEDPERMMSMSRAASRRADDFRIDRYARELQNVIEELSGNLSDSEGHFS